MSTSLALRVLLASATLVLGMVLTPRWLTAFHEQNVRAEVKTALLDGDLTTASTLLERASDRRPQDPALAADAGAVALIWATWGGGRPALDSAGRLLGRAIDHDPNDSASMARLSDVRDRSGQGTEAFALLREALALDPANQEYLVRAAALLAATGHPEEAAAYAARARTASAGR